MTAVDTHFESQNIDGTRNIWAFVISSGQPETLPTNGANVAGMTAKDKFAPFSIIYVNAQYASPKLYVANEQGVFVAQ